MDHARKPLVVIVEDEPLVRFVAREGLVDAGYAVLEARDAAEAIALISARPDVCVLFTDVNMPGDLDGLSLAELVHARWPAIRLLVTSGRPLDRAVPDHGEFLGKPYTIVELTRALEASASESSKTGTCAPPRR